MRKKPTLQQKIKQIRKLDGLLTVVFTTTALGGNALLVLAFVFKQCFEGLFVSGIGCFVLMMLVCQFQERVAQEKNLLNLKQSEDEKE